VVKPDIEPSMMESPRSAEPPKPLSSATGSTRQQASDNNDRYKNRPFGQFAHGNLLSGGCLKGLAGAATRGIVRTGFSADFEIMRPNIAPLTSARFFAALLVVFFHYDKKLQLFPTGLADFGYEAVTFFFILSGFVLSYTHGRDDGLNVSVNQFARSRLLRILPAYVLALIVAFPFFLAGAIKTGNVDLAAALVPPMLQSWWPPAALLWNSPAWSLSNEIFFYALYPLIWTAWRGISPRASLIAAASLVLAVSAFRAAIPHDTEGWRHFSAYFPVLNLPQFLLGIALAKLFLITQRQNTTRLFYASVAAMVAIIALKTEQHWLADGAILCAVFGAMVYGLAGLKGLPLAILSIRPLAFLGDASYAIYILHVPAWLWWDRAARVSLGLQWPAALDFSCYLGSVLALSIGAMLLVERPVRAWLRQGFALA
jgi:peptidoglycan/LPS O-acetylase OafA/YrhL